MPGKAGAHRAMLEFPAEMPDCLSQRIRDLNYALKFYLRKSLVLNNNFCVFYKANRKLFSAVEGTNDPTET
jgi:hypothetical protein